MATGVSLMRTDQGFKARPGLSASTIEPMDNVQVQNVAGLGWAVPRRYNALVAQGRHFALHRSNYNVTRYELYNPIAVF